MFEGVYLHVITSKGPLELGIMSLDKALSILETGAVDTNLHAVDLEEETVLGYRVDRGDYVFYVAPIVHVNEKTPRTEQWERYVTHRVHQSLSEKTVLEIKNLD